MKFATAPRANGITMGEIGDPNLLNRCLSGEIFIIPRFLQKTGLLDTVHNALLRAVKDNCGTGVAGRINTHNSEKLHEHLPPASFPEITRSIDDFLREDLIAIYKKILKVGFGYDDPIWVLGHIISRMIIPFDKTLPSRDKYTQFSKQRQGRVTTLRPHRDCWYAEPLSCINLWLPFSNTMPGNGIAIFPDEYANALNYVPDLGITRDQRISAPVELYMHAGDALMFHANHLHGSELNHTKETRCSLSIRLALSDPRSSSKSPNRYRRVAVSRPLSFLQLHRNKKIKKFATRLYRPDIENNAGPAANLQQVDDTLADSDRSLSPGPYNGRYTGEISLSELSYSEPVAVSREHMLIRINVGKSDQVWRMERRCPHEGADLSLGRVEGNNIRCPWHNLPIDITTGISLCKTLRSIPSRKCRIEGDVVKFD